jgi:hypothetical protein
MRIGAVCQGRRTGPGGGECLVRECMTIGGVCIWVALSGLLDMWGSPGLLAGGVPRCEWHVLASVFTYAGRKVLRAMVWLRELV